MSAKAGCYAVVAIPDNAIFPFVQKMVTHIQILPVEHLPQYLQVVRSSPTWDRVISHVCAHIGICGFGEMVASIPHSLSFCSFQEAFEGLDLDADEDYDVEQMISDYKKKGGKVKGRNKTHYLS